MSSMPLSLPRGHEHPACLVSLAAQTIQTFEGCKSSTWTGLWEAPPASPLLPPWSLDKGEPGSMCSDVGGT